MVRLLVTRVVRMATVVMAVAVVTFVLMHQAPGGPWVGRKPISATARRNLDARFGLDKPLWLNLAAYRAERASGTIDPRALGGALVDSQFFRYLGGALHLDFGPSLQARGAQSVRAIIGRTLPASAKVGLVALLFAGAVGLPAGGAAALTRRAWLDRSVAFLTTACFAAPSFVVGVLLVMVLSRRFGVSPIRQPEEWAGFGAAYLAPGIVLGLGPAAYLARLTRAGLIEARGHDFVRTARAKGLSESHVVTRHMLRHGLLPVVTVTGPLAAALVTGSLPIEAIFGVPGMGQAFFQAIANRDYPVIMGTTLLYAALIAIANAVVDVAYVLIDPRLRRRP